ncbi:uncharacterized protein LOC105202324 [Solenopsis invicta]|uniref:uncharacterized protein LOC105202324 n=1 Tax=Solenopsis invicta TaxID=13686 RepID=UPI00193CB6AA|nr:uncharacterized protein LOC105202324 [Solenopsis invicta]XP_039305027.1 uncharacterized protein LOC105202324 [Solenopsis invicta]XP_039305028.1 uncharacterized protein LOC105202324 [Solenopsis invicta]XP_039305029.1 uncharacterized protein LOC105202324 [Solenopsis invicta]
MKIETFVFFDLETTNLIQANVMPRITEVALVAVSRESIFSCNKNSLPRVLHKLVLPVNPQRIIPPHVEDMTKLYHHEMQLLQPFEKGGYELITYFLQRLTPPICFAAHNGDKFDYPVFLEELNRINKILDNEILCIDTWKMFQDFFKKRKLESKEVQELLNDEYNDSFSILNMDVDEAIDIVTVKEPRIDVATTSTKQSIFPCDKYTKIINSKIQEHSDYVTQSWKNFLQKSNERTPKNQIIKLENVPQRPFKKNIPKRLNFKSEKPNSLKLSDIYEYMFDMKIAGNHSAEADCLAMIRCVTRIDSFFLNWSDNHATPLRR